MAQTPTHIDQRIFDLYDEYCHGRIDRREFLKRASALTVAGGSAWRWRRRCCRATRRRRRFPSPTSGSRRRYVDYPSPGGNSGSMRGYLVQPAGSGPFPAVLVIHENRGLNPYIEDVARRLAVDGFLALAPDGLAPVGGYPGQRRRRARAAGEARPGEAAHRHAEQRAVPQGARSCRPASSACTGFCWGGGTTN